jgi:hypothetical protein
MDKVDLLFKAYDYIVSTARISSNILWVFIDGYTIHAVFCGRNARRASNALYHALRAAARHWVRRTAADKKGCRVVSYV